MVENTQIFSERPAENRLKYHEWQLSKRKEALDGWQKKYEETQRLSHSHIVKQFERQIRSLEETIRKLREEIG